MKAIDYSAAFGCPDPASALNQLTREFLFERDLCLACAEKAFDHVVVAIDHGTYVQSSGNPLTTIQYIIFELADGDIRKHLMTFENIDVAFALRALHNVAVGLQQLHSLPAAHQDLKPSNVLQFADRISKIADLGRAATFGTTCPFDGLEVAGDLGYAPPELLYAHILTDWRERRQGCDLYLFGSLILFMFTGCTMTGELVSRIPPDHRPGTWGGRYEEVLPYVQNALARTLEAIEHELPAQWREELLDMIRRLCNPDPARRGFRDGDPSSARQTLERCISRFDLLATKAVQSRPRRST